MSDAAAPPVTSLGDLPAPGAPGRIALVTGAAGGIGSACCQALAAAGWSVVGTDLPGSGVELEADLRDRGSAETIMESVAQRYGRLDLLLNNAATMHFAPCSPEALEAFWSLMEVNLTAPFRLVRAGLGLLRASAGQVVNVASVFGIRPEAGYSAYCASKAGLIGLTRALALELAPTVRVNAIAPGHTDTPQQAVDAAVAGVSRDELYRSYATSIPIGRILRPGEIADLVVHLATSTGYTGSCIVLDGGHLLG